MITLPKPVTVTPIETVGPLKPSEAIRLGALDLPHAIGALFEFDTSGNIIGACPMGMMARSYGVILTPHDDEVTQFWPKDFFWANGRMPRFKSPCNGSIESLCGGHDEKQPITNIIEHLNDDHRWGVARLADWVESKGF